MVLTLRPAKMADAAFLFRLRTDPVTAANSPGRIPTELEHAA